MILKLCTMWLKGHCRAVVAYQKNSRSPRPPTMALRFTAPLHTSWCRINCDHSSTARNAPPTLHDITRGSSSCGPRMSTQNIIFEAADDGTFDHRASTHVLVQDQLRSFIRGAECSSNFARYGSRVIVVRSPHINAKHHL